MAPAIGLYEILFLLAAFPAAAGNPLFPLLLPVAALTEGAPPALDLPEVLAFAYLSIVCTAIARPVMWRIRGRAA